MLKLNIYSGVLLLCAGICLPTPPRSISAQTTGGTAISIGDEICIEGWINDEQDTLEGSFYLSLPDVEDTTAIRIILSELTHEQNNHTILPSKVTITGPLLITDSNPHFYELSAIGIEAGGSYRGYLEIAKADRGNSLIVIPVTIMAHITPALSPLFTPDATNLKLVRGQRRSSVLMNNLPTLQSLVLPRGAFLDRIDLTLENSVDDTVRILDSMLDVRGGKRGECLPDTALYAKPKELTFSPGEIERYSLTIDRSLIRSDRYTGHLYLRLDGREDRLGIPIEINMRDRALLVFLVLLIAIIARFFIQRCFKRPDKPNDVINRINTLSQKVNSSNKYSLKQLKKKKKEVAAQRAGGESPPTSNEPPFTPSFLDMLEVAKHLNYAVSSEMGRLQVTAIEARFQSQELLDQVSADLNQQNQEIESEIHKVILQAGETGSKPPSQKEAEFQEQQKTITKLLHTLNEAKDCLKSEKDEDAARALQEELKRSPTSDIFHLESTARINWAKASYKAHRAAKNRRVSTSLDLLEKSLKTGRTIKRMGLPETCRFGKLARSRSWILLLLFLVTWVSGFGFIYVLNGASFGAHWFIDYSTLFLWGLGGEFGSRKIGLLNLDKIIPPTE